MGNDGRLLIIDNNIESARALAGTLAELGYGVDTAETGRAGLRALSTGAHDLVLLDLSLPDMSGLDVLGSVRGQRGMVELPVIMLTAKPRDQDVVEALSRGANDIITKPANLPVIHTRIRTQINLSRAERALKLSEERYALAAAATRDGLWDWKLAEERIFVSANWRLIANLSDGQESVSFEDWLSLLHPADRETFSAAMLQLRGGQRERMELECRLRRPDGSLRWVSVRGILVLGQDGRPQRLAGAMSDVTDSRLYHSLTKLPAVPLLQEAMDRLLENRQPGSRPPGSLAFIDLDGFRFLNQAYGHANGDLAIQTIARRIKSALGPRDILAHYGRDEFLAFFEGLDDPAAILDRVGRLLDRIQAPIAREDGEAEMVITACAGIAILDSDYRSAARAVQDAESAMHMAKREGANRCRFFRKDYYERIRERLEREKDLRAALRESQFVLVYQPLVRVADGALAGFEALIRRIEPDGNLVMPDRLIPLAEENGMIGKLGEWILRTACAQIKEWERRGTRPPRVAVNLSPIQFSDEDLASTLTDIIRSTDIDPGLLELEITESKAMENPVETIRIMQRLRDIGVSFSIDDFGTGYSSLSMLQRFPLSTLKIDKTFISEVPASAGAMSIVEAIIAMARSMHFSTIAEGVETRAQLDFLKQAGCDCYQGYYMSGPVGAAEAGAFLRKHARA